ncbi:MAG: hypothetical protein J5614_08870 [Paludibacteraceae bacterium]|nr:hypothetical protein [Paludibacteraceae bacterium]
MGHKQSCAKHGDSVASLKPIEEDVDEDVEESECEESVEEYHESEHTDSDEHHWKHIERIEDAEKIIYKYQRSKQMKDGSVKTVTEQRVYYKSKPAYDRRDRLQEWISSNSTDIFKCKLSSMYPDYCIYSMKTNVKPFCYNNFVKKINDYKKIVTERKKDE